MKKLKQSSVSAAWFVRAKSMVSAAPARTSGERLDLVLPRGWPDSGSPVFWRWRKGNGTPQSGLATDLQQLPDNARRSAAHVWTPAADTMLTSVSLPTRARRKIMQALPYALEDRLLGDPDSLHFAYRSESDGSLSVAITARDRLRVWMEALTKAGIQPAALCPATLMVPWPLDCWSLAFGEDEVLVRTGSASGFVAPLSKETPPPLLVAALRDLPEQGRQGQHDDQRRAHQPGQRSRRAAPAKEALADDERHVDDVGPGQYLTQRQQCQELVLAHPALTLDELTLRHGQHATKALQCQPREDDPHARWRRRPQQRRGHHHQRSTFSASGLTRFVGVLLTKLTMFSNAARKYVS